jgi:hypothetical protein
MHRMKSILPIGVVFSAQISDRGLRTIDGLLYLFKMYILCTTYAECLNWELGNILSSSKYGFSWLIPFLR